MYNIYKNMLSRVMSWISSSPRWQLIKEEINFSVKIDDPIKCWFNFPSREFNYKYLAAELVWYTLWNLETKNISKYAKLWDRISFNWEAHSNYWYLVYWRWIEETNNSQFNWAIDSLIKDKDSRQAIIRYNNDEVQYEWVKDFICTMYQHFFIRDNKLICITNMRSNDLFYWFSYDIIWFSLVQQNMYLELKEVYPDIKLWEIYFNTSSAHIYEPMFKKTDIIIKEEWNSINFELIKWDLEFNIDTIWEELEKTKDYKKFIEDNFKIKITDERIKN